MLIEKLVRVEVDVEDYITEYGSDPYGDGRPIEEAIEVDVEQALSECEILPYVIDYSVEVG